ncbi:unnamed protein product [Ambrosiozyma monospora]|uniref:Unnamed protein product n=1 Tax=Ambrosiozyma monospora TaxID=43982 RepID=A0ACB5TD96_AMBMO|nr:unnamed protein product [Ambrosiozyma monospora]
MPSDNIVALLDNITLQKKDDFHKILNALPLEIQLTIAKFFFNERLKEHSEYHTEYTDIMVKLGYKLYIFIVSEDELSRYFILDGSPVGCFRYSSCYFKQFFADADFRRFPIERLEIACYLKMGPMDMLIKLIDISETFLYDRDNDLIEDPILPAIRDKVNELTIHSAFDLPDVLENISFYQNLNHLIIEIYEDDDDESIKEYLGVGNIRLACQLLSEVTIIFYCTELIKPKYYTKLIKISNLNVELSGLQLTTEWLPYLDTLIENKVDISYVDLDEYTYSPFRFKRLITYDLVSHLQITCQDNIEGYDFTGKNFMVCQISAATMKNCDLSGLKNFIKLSLNLINTDLKTLESIPDSVSELDLNLQYNLVSIIDPNSKFVKSLPTNRKLSLPKRLHNLSTNTPSVFDVFDISSAKYLVKLQLLFDELGIYQFSKLDEGNALWDNIPKSVERIIIKLNTVITAEKSPVIYVRLNPSNILITEIQITEIVPASVIYLTSFSNPRIIKQIKSIGRPYLVISGVVCNTVHIRSLNWVGVTPYAHHLIIANEDARLINVKNTDLVKAYGDSDIESTPK